MTCSRCQTINPQGAVACAACGAPLVAMPMQPGYGPPGQPYMVMAPMQQARSGIPKVVGILMIVFGSIMLLLGLAGLAGDQDKDSQILFAGVKEWETYLMMSKVFGVVGLLVSAFHLYVGIRAVGYKRNAPTLAVTYGIASIGSTLLNLILVFAWIKPALDKIAPGASSAVGAGLAVGGMLAIAWPVIVLALMTRPAAKASCVN